MIVQINSLERGSHTTSGGNTQTGLYVYGTKLDQDGNLGEDWDKFLAEAFYADQIAAFEKIGAGNVANVRMVKSGRFWNVDSVTPVSGSGGGGSPTGGAGRKPVSSGGGGAPAKSGNYRDPDEIIRTTALNGAINYVKAAMEFQSAGKAKLFPVTKLNLELLTDKIEEIAGKFTNFIKGKNGMVTESDTSGLQEPRQEPDMPLSIPDDDIPF